MTQLFNLSVDQNAANAANTTEVPTFNTIMLNACECGFTSIVKLAIKHGANNWVSGYHRARHVGHMELMKLMVYHGLLDACKNGDIRMAKQFIRCDIFDYDEGLQVACENGHIELVELMLKYGANINEGLLKACENGHIKLVELMLKYGANNYNEGLKMARNNDHIQVIELMNTLYVDVGEYEKYEDLYNELYNKELLKMYEGLIILQKHIMILVGLTFLTLILKK